MPRNSGQSWGSLKKGSRFPCATRLGPSCFPLCTPLLQRVSGLSPNPEGAIWTIILGCALGSISENLSKPPAEGRPPAPRPQHPGLPFSPIPFSFHPVFLPCLLRLPSWCFYCRFHVLNCLQTTQRVRQPRNSINRHHHRPRPVSGKAEKSLFVLGAQNGSRLLNHSARFRRSPSVPLDERPGSSAGQEGEEGETQPVWDPSPATEFLEGEAQPLERPPSKFQTRKEKPRELTVRGKSLFPATQQVWLPGDWVIRALEMAAFWSEAKSPQSHWLQVKPPPLSGVAKLPLPALGPLHLVCSQQSARAVAQVGVPGRGEAASPNPSLLRARAERQRTQTRGCRKGPRPALPDTCPPQRRGGECRLAHLPQRRAQCLPCQGPRTGRGIPVGALGLDAG